LFGRNDNPCGYDTLLITLLLGKRFGTLAISDHQQPHKIAYTSSPKQKMLHLAWQINNKHSTTCVICGESEIIKKSISKFIILHKFTQAPKGGS